MTERTEIEMIVLLEILMYSRCVFFFSSRRRHTRFDCDWSSDVCSSDLEHLHAGVDVDGVDDQRPLELREGEVAHEPVEQFVERLAAEQGGGPHPLERHVDRKSVV